MSDLGSALEDLYGPERAEAPLRLTDGGLWHATPVGVLTATVSRLPDLLAEVSGVGSAPLLIFDAGAGDGRLLSALALGLPADREVRLLGLEIDADLAAAARERCSRLALPESVDERRPRVARGDFLAAPDYARLGITPAQLDLVFNYPDGNEHRLLAWLRRHGGPRTHLLILSPDQDPALSASPRARIRVPTGQGDGVAWSLSVYATALEEQ